MNQPMCTHTGHKLSQMLQGYYSDQIIISALIWRRKRWHWWWCKWWCCNYPEECRLSWSRGVNWRNIHYQIFVRHTMSQCAAILKWKYSCHFWLVWSGNTCAISDPFGVEKSAASAVSWIPTIVSRILLLLVQYLVGKSEKPGWKPCCSYSYLPVFEFVFAFVFVSGNPRCPIQTIFESKLSQCFK